MAAEGSDVHSSISVDNVFHDSNGSFGIFASEHFISLNAVFPHREQILHLLQAF